jgi:hypothetical protein
MYVILYKNNKCKTRTIHQLVAQTFIDNSNKLPQVNHIDGNKQNNRVDNLEWCTPSENKLHSYKTLKEKHFTRKVICIDTGIEYESIIEASIATNSNRQHICNCCKGKRNKCGGYRWKYKD